MDFDLLRCALQNLQYNQFGFTKEDIDEAMLDVNALDVATPSPDESVSGQVVNALRAPVP